MTDGTEELRIHPMLARLSGREREFLLLFAQDLPTKEIAGRMDISESAAATYKIRLMKKLGMLTEFRLIVFCVRYGLLD